MYNEYFGLEEMPFSIAPDPRYLYMSELHREALAHLVYGINSNGGFVLLTGEVGTGKTTICRCLLEQTPENAEIAFILNPKLTVEELLATICDEFGIKYPAGNTSIKVFVDVINSYLLDAHSKGKKAVLIIDEAQNLSQDVLEQLRLLTNLETDQCKLLHIILMGQPELKDKLSQPELRQLAQRIIVRYHLGPLSRKDVAAYVIHRLAIAGFSRHSLRQLFPSSTIDSLYRLSRGVPRLINLLCDRALLGAYARGKDRVSKSILGKASREVFGDATSHKLRWDAPGWLLPGLLVVFAAALAVSYYNSYDKVYSNYKSKPITAERTKPASRDTPKPQTAAQELDTLQWTAGQPVLQSKEMAFTALFKQWNLSYKPHELITECQQALAHGLVCLSARGSLTSLRRLNRPAVLKLFSDKGQEFYATLTALDKETALFIVGNETRKIAVKDIAMHWFGDYTVLWRMLPEFQGNILPGYQGPVVEWLDKQLAMVQGRLARSGENPVFDNELVKQVKKFQFARGLIPDGIVGPQTIIRLNTAVGMGIPVLTGSQGEK